MIEWLESPISEIGEVVSGGTPSTSVEEYWKDGNILFVTPYDLSRNKSVYINNTERKITKRGLVNSSANLLPKGSVVISSRAPIGYISVGLSDFTTNQGCKSIIPNSDFDSVFLYYDLNFYVNRIKRLGEGTTFDEISKGELEKIYIPFPDSLPTQRKISKILITADAVIEKTEDAISKHKAIKQGMLHDLFTRGIDLNFGRLRPKPEEAPGLYENKGLGLIPKDWNPTVFEDICDGIGDGIHTTPKYSDNTDFYFINGNNLWDGKVFITKNTKTVSKDEFEKHFIPLTERTLLLSINGTIGNTAFYRGEKVILGKSAAYINCKNNVDKFFVYYFLQTDRVLKYFDKEVTGSTIKNLSLQSIRNTPLGLPRPKEQFEIGQRLSAIEQKLKKELDYLKKLTSVKHGLMSDLLTGKVPVKVEEMEVEV